MTETSEYWALISPVFRSSVIQMPGSYYLPGKKIVGYSDHHLNNRLKLSGIQIIIQIKDHLIGGLLSTLRIPD